MPVKVRLDSVFEYGYINTVFIVKLVFLVKLESLINLLKSKTYRFSQNFPIPRIQIFTTVFPIRY